MLRKSLAPNSKNNIYQVPLRLICRSILCENLQTNEPHLDDAFCFIFIGVYNEACYLKSGVVSHSFAAKKLSNDVVATTKQGKLFFLRRNLFHNT